MTPLFIIGDRTSMWAIGDVREMDLARVHAGQKVTLRVPAHPEAVFEGEVGWVSGQTDPATHATALRCTVPNPSGELEPDMSGTLTIATSERRLAVPASSVVGRGDDAVVFVLAGEGPKARSASNVAACGSSTACPVTGSPLSRASLKASRS